METEQIPVAQEAEAQTEAGAPEGNPAVEELNPKKGGLPAWVVALVLLVCFIAIYETYSYMTADKITYLKPRKA